MRYRDLRAAAKYARAREAEAADRIGTLPEGYEVTFIGEPDDDPLWHAKRPDTGQGDGRRCVPHHCCHSSPEEAAEACRQDAAGVVFPELPDLFEELSGADLTRPPPAGDP